MQLLSLPRTEAAQNGPRSLFKGPQALHHEGPEKGRQQVALDEWQLPDAARLPAPPTGSCSVALTSSFPPTTSRP